MHVVLIFHVSTFLQCFDKVEALVKQNISKNMIKGVNFCKK